MSHSCRSCGGTGVRPILSFGRMPLANRLLTADQLEASEPRYPLDLAFCPGCALVQIIETVAPEELFGEYAYFTSVSDTMVRHAEALAARMCHERNLGGEHLVIEIASNDGYLLQFYQQHSVPILGIEPAANVARFAQDERGIPTMNEFFGDVLARELVSQGRRADVIHANNVLAHVADLNGFVRGIRLLLRDNGVAVIEVPYVRDLVERGEFDTIYHEHLCYFSLTALEALFRRHDLVLQDVERLPVHGGSLRLFVGREANQSAAVREMREQEAALGMDDFDFYRQFGEKVESIKRTLCNSLCDLKQQGVRLAAYGAAAKGATLLNYCGIGADVLDYVVDRSPHKQGRYLPGVHLPIHPPERLLETRPDYLLVLAWNLADEIIAQQAEYRAGGGRFILPIPDARIVE